MIGGDLNQQVGGHGVTVTVHKAKTFACWGRVNKKKDMSKVAVVKDTKEDEPKFEEAQTMQMCGLFEGFPLRFNALFGLVNLNTLSS